VSGSLLREAAGLPWLALVSLRAADGTTISIAVILFCLGYGIYFIEIITKIDLAGDSQQLSMLLSMDLVVKARIQCLVIIHVVMISHILTSFVSS